MRTAAARALSARSICRNRPDERADPRCGACLDAPGFAAFDTGRIGDGPDDVAAAEAQTARDAVEAETSAGAEHTGPASDSHASQEDSPAAVVSNGHEGSAALNSEAPVANAENAGNAAVKAADTRSTADAGRRGVADHAMPVDGHDPAKDPLVIPEFLRRVY